jgi:hypothetical protein
MFSVGARPVAALLTCLHVWLGLPMAGEMSTFCFRICLASRPTAPCCNINYVALAPHIFERLLWEYTNVDGGGLKQQHNSGSQSTLVRVQISRACDLSLSAEAIL